MKLGAEAENGMKGRGGLRKSSRYFEPEITTLEIISSLTVTILSTYMMLPVCKYQKLVFCLTELEILKVKFLAEHGVLM